MSNKTSTVVRFEVMRSLKKPSFWLAAILLPILLGAYIFVAAITGYNTGENLTAGTDTSNMILAITDDAEYLQYFNYIDADGEEKTFEVIENKDDAIAQIKNKEIDVLYYLPADFAETLRIEIYTKPERVSLLDDYTTPIRALLSSIALSNVEAIDYAIITNTLNYQTTAFSIEDDHEIAQSEVISNLISPLVALILFYILLVVLGNRLVAAVTEEKENRISELVLTSIKPSNLIYGKVISLMILGIIQLAVLIIPIIAVMTIAQKWNSLPIDLSTLSLDPLNIIAYIILLITSYFLFTIMSVAIGAISPTAKDANSYQSVIVIITILPMLFMNAFMNNPQITTYVLTYFPPSAPMAIMLRAIFGTLPTWELILGIIDIIIASIIITRLATWLFCRNAINFTSKVNFKKLLTGPRKTWKN